MLFKYEEFNFVQFFFYQLRVLSLDIHWMHAFLGMQTIQSSYLKFPDITVKISFFQTISLSR